MIGVPATPAGAGEAPVVGRMRIHVTGGRGFLGRYVVAGLETRHDVVVSDVDDLDVTSPTETLEGLSDRPETVCHLAGLTGAVASSRQVERYFRVNTGGTLNVLEACRRHSIRHLVFLSTLTVHGRSTEPVDEDSPIRPRHPYAASKAAAELLVRTYARSYGLRTTILRATLIAGEHQAEANAVSQFVDAALAGDEIRIFGDGSHEREWLHPDDLAAAVRLAVERPTNDASPDSSTFLISPGHPISMRHLAERVIRHLGRGTITHTETTGQAFSLTTDSRRARETLGWEPRVTIDEIIERVARWRRETA